MVFWLFVEQTKTGCNKQKSCIFPNQHWMIAFFSSLSLIATLYVYIYTIKPIVNIWHEKFGQWFFQATFSCRLSSAQLQPDSDDFSIFFEKPSRMCIGTLFSILHLPLFAYFSFDFFFASFVFTFHSEMRFKPCIINLCCMRYSKETVVISAKKKVCLENFLDWSFIHDDLTLSYFQAARSFVRIQMCAPHRKYITRLLHNHSSNIFNYNFFFRCFDSTRSFDVDIFFKKIFWLSHFVHLRFFFLPELDQCKRQR